MSRVAILVAVAACSHADAVPPPSPPLHSDVLQRPFVMSDVVLAIADDWTSTKVTVTHWEPATRWAGWAQTGGPWPAVIGNGLAWGDGLHGHGAPKGHVGPVKHEGDGKSPAGAFRITERFAFDPVQRGHTITDATECVDDPFSASYNEIVERTGSADWHSSEHMHRNEQYELGAVIDHNPSRTPGLGSCIFLHIWAGPDSTTIGCTAMEYDSLANLLSSLGKHPVFVLLPRDEYEALRKPWGLPAQ